MNTVTKLLTDHMDVWTAADTEKKSGRGRSAAGSGSVYGIKKLRELILELAVRGKLVPQGPNDEPSSQLLKRIEIERAQLQKNGSIKPEKPYPRIDTKVAPFPVPDGWTWVNLAQIGHDWGQTSPEGQFTYIEVSAIDSNLGIVSSPEVVEANDAPSRARKTVRSGTVIYSTVRPYLRNIAVIEDDFSPSPIASTAFAVIHPFCEMPPRYILAYLRSPPFVRYVESVQTGIAYPAINDKQFFSGLFPLPPLAEQHRIVAKVDELMALCDQLEVEQLGAAEAHENLVAQILGTLTASKNAEDFATNWQRIATHFDTLFTTESSIDAFKKTILQLAIMGKLVPQDPDDEPAGSFLLQGESKTAVHKANKFSEVQKQDRLFKVPNGWEWARIGDISTFLGGYAYESSKFSERSANQVLRLGNIKDAGILIDSNPVYIDDIYASKTQKFKVLKDDVLVTMTGTKEKEDYLFCTTVSFDQLDEKNLYLNQRIGCLRSQLVKPRFIELLFKSPCIRKALYEVSTGTANQANIGSGQILAQAVPVAPIGEQHRIVAKVDELMTLCDQLKSRLSEANRVQQTLADALVSQAVA